jgi:hypothetical protein
LKKENFVFIGNFLHEPNWNAVQYLKETIWPLIKKASEAVLNVYGLILQKVLQLNNGGFYDKRSCPNANEVVQHARLVLAPLRFGQELKEIIRSYAMWNPSVTTSIGAESMHGDSYGMVYNG